MENEDKIVAGLKLLHEDFEKLTASIEKQRESARSLVVRQSRLNIGVYLTVVGALVLWLAYHYH
jgi:hypothetical protein